MFSGAYDLGSAQINGGGAYQFNLRTLPEQATVTSINITIACTAAASATTTFVNPQPIMLPEGNDDVDRVLSAILVGIDLNISPSIQTLANLSLPRLRTGLAYMNDQDIQAPSAGSTVATGGTVLNFNIIVPVGLHDLLPDFSCLRSGALRFSSAGQMNFNYANLTGGNFTGTFNQGTTFTIAPATVSIRLQAELAQLSFGGGLVGAVWDLKYSAGVPVTGVTKPGIHLALFDQTGQPSTGVAGYAPTAYNIFNGPNSLTQNNSPAQLIANYRRRRLFGYTVDGTARGIPMQYYDKKNTAMQVDQSGGAITYQVTETQSNTLFFLELTVTPPSAGDLMDVARRINGGGKVAVDRGTYHSIDPQRPGPAAAVLTPVIMYPSGIAPAGLPLLDPADVGKYVSDGINSAQGSAKAAAPYGAAGHSLLRQRR